MKNNLILMGILTFLGTFSFAQNPSSNEQSQTKGPTYNWIVPDMKTNQNPMYSSSFSRQRIQKAFDSALAGIGFSRNTKHPDYLLQFHTYTQRIHRNYFGGGGYPMMGFGRYGWGIPYGMYGGGGFGYGGYPSTTTNTDGTLILDLVDTKTGDIIWQKAISGDVSNPNRLDKQINKGVKKLMKDFPVRS